MRKGSSGDHEIYNKYHGREVMFCPEADTRVTSNFGARPLGRMNMLSKLHCIFIFRF